MNTCHIIIPSLALTLVSCDKAKDIAAKAASAVKQEIAVRTGDPEPSKVDEELQKLVDQTPEGVVFRKDLPFPSHLQVRTTCRREMSVRFFQTSAIERRAATVNGTQVAVTKLERSGDQVRFTLEQSGFSVPSAADPDGEEKKIANPLEQVAPSTRPVTFTKSGNRWKTADSNGFHAAVLSRQLAPVLDELLIENAVAPHSMWFGKRRIKIGDEFDVTAANLPMLVAGRAKGSLHLKFEAIEGVGGHPCGVFSVTGDYSRKEFPDFEGNLTDEDVSIQSGKLWLSLLHPVILKEELDTIQTFRSGGNGNLSGRGQGAVKLSVQREWKAVTP